MESSLADHGVRKYDYETGRFTSCDAMWDKYIDLNPYQYCNNNPISCFDDDGMKIKPAKSKYQNINYRTMIFNDIMQNSKTGKKLINYLNKQIDFKVIEGNMLPGQVGFCDVSTIVTKDARTGKNMSTRIQSIDVIIDANQLKGDYNEILMNLLEELFHAYQAFSNPERWNRLNKEAHDKNIDYKDQPLENEAKDNARKIYFEIQETLKNIDK